MRRVNPISWTSSVFLQDIAKNEGGGLQEAVAGRGGVPIIRNLVTEQEAEIAIDISLADTLQRDESYRSRPASASPAELFRCTCYLDTYVRIEAPSKPTRHPTAEDDFQQNSCRH